MYIGYWTLNNYYYYVAMLTHYTTETLTTGPDYDPLLLLLARASNVHLNPGLPRYPCSVCFKNVTSPGTISLCTRFSYWVHSRCSGLLNVADYRCCCCMPSETYGRNGVIQFPDLFKELPVPPDSWSRWNIFMCFYISF